MLGNSRTENDAACLTHKFVSSILLLLSLGAMAQESDKADDIWGALSELAEEVEKFEAGEEPDYGPVRLVTSGGAYPAGRFTGVCRYYTQPRPYKNGDRFTNLHVTTHFQRLRGGEWTGVGGFTKLDHIGKREDCSKEDYLWLGDPSDPLRGPGQYKYVVQGYEEDILYQNNYVVSSERREIYDVIDFQIVEEPGDCANADVIISSPYDRYQFSFDGSQDGRLQIDATATVSPADCEDDIYWSADSIGDVEATIEPPLGANVSITYAGMAEENADFGPLNISARILGAGETREVLVFFDPLAKNHPGERSGDTPNWFYYWGQTSAQGDFSMPQYVSRMPACSATDSSAMARYMYDTDVIYMVDLAYRGSCVTRQGDVIDTGKTAEGIDCFAELIRHEDVHRVELKQWWAPFKGQASPAACGLSTDYVINEIADIDDDGDLVPDIIEAALTGTRGCETDDDRSCSGRPVVNGKSPIDVEMNAYTIGWNAWKMGHADTEDWSKCGAQWSNKSGCKYK